MTQPKEMSLLEGIEFLVKKDVAGSEDFRFSAVGRLEATRALYDAAKHKGMAR